MAVAALCRKLGAERIFGIDVLPERLQLARDLGLCDEVIPSGPENISEILELTSGRGVERAVECSGNHEARPTAIRATRRWGRIVFLGEGSTVQSSLLPISCTTRRRSTVPGSPP